MERREINGGLRCCTEVTLSILLLTLPAAPQPYPAPAYQHPASSGNTHAPKIAVSPTSDDPQAILQSARAALKAGNQGKAARILARLPASDGESHFAAATMLVERKAYAAAAREFHIARQTYKDPYIAGYDETLAYVNAENYTAALATANDLLNHGYRTAELAELAATAYRKSGRTQEAYNALRLAAHLNPKNEDAYIELCEMALDKDDYDLGLQIANIGISNLPASGHLYLQRGVMRAMKGQFGEAEKDFTRASELDPNEVLPDVALGLVAMQIGNLDGAVRNLRRAVARHPDNYLAQYWFSKALEHAGAAPGTKEGAEVLSALEESVRLNPNFWHSRADLGKTLLDNGKVEPAIIQLQKAADLNPTATGPLYLLAQAYRRKGDNARARELVARVSTMQAEDRDALAKTTLKNIGREDTSASPAGQVKP
ncbi:MAG: tetratricopeptide repeat protein [Terriglobia bacterium]